MIFKKEKKEIWYNKCEKQSSNYESNKYLLSITINDVYV